MALISYVIFPYPTLFPYPTHNLVVYLLQILLWLTVVVHQIHITFQAMAHQNLLDGCWSASTVPFLGEVFSQIFYSDWCLMESINTRIFGEERSTILLWDLEILGKYQLGFGSKEGDSASLRLGCFLLYRIMDHVDSSIFKIYILSGELVQFLWP